MIEKECIDYFKGKPGFRRLFEGLREKYRSLGSLGGVIKLNNLNELEKEALSGLFRKDYYSKKSAAIKVEMIYKALEGTRFQGVALEAVVRGYFKEELISKKDEKDFYNAEKELFFEEILQKFEKSKAFYWLDSIMKNRTNAYKLLSQNYDKNKEELRDKLIQVMHGLNKLSFSSSELKRLALFSSKISKDPHTFDDNTLAGNLLLYGIIYCLGLDYPKSAEAKSEVLYQAGLIKDEISNFTTISGLIAYKYGEVHKGWDGFYSNYEPVNINIWNISEIDSVVSNYNKVYIFENPTVFSQVLEELKHFNPPLICTYGQLKLASLALIDRLIDNVDQIFYSGDFDPEGLSIADKLKSRYREKLILWRLNKDEYRSIKSNNNIEPSRIKKLDSIKNLELQVLAKEIKKEGLAAYQELLTEKYIEDVKFGIGFKL